MKPYILFISDLHLDPSETAITDAFLQLLKTDAAQAQALYILGDFFEAWLGDDDLNPFNRQIIQALRKLSDSGVKLFFMRGNRDFLIGKKFAKRAGLNLLADPHVADLFGHRVLLMHGDLLCTQDEKYQAFRKVVNNRFYQFLALRLPLFIRRKIGRKMRAKSKQHHGQVTMAIMDVTPTEVVRVMHDAKTDLLIHGHTHRPAVHTLEVDQKPAKRVVLGAWDQQPQILFYYSDHQFELRSLHNGSRCR